MRFHLFGVAYAPVRYEHCICPFTSATHRMARMIKAAGHELILYGPAGSDAPCDEFVEVVSRQCLEQQTAPAGSVFRYNESLTRADPIWQEFIARARLALRQRHRPGDLALISFGKFHAFALAVAPLTVEFWVGYSGTCARYKVFPSHVWYHYLLNEYVHTLGQAWPSWEDVVILHCTDKERFTLVEKKEDYLCFIGRLIPEKGVDIAAEVAHAAGRKLLVAGRCQEGREELPDWLKDKPAIEYVGAVGHEQRVRLMSRARALLCPTRYVEPFGMTTIEAMACGTPVISSDFGALVETNVHGLTGFRCHDFDELVQATQEVDQLVPARIRAHFESTFSVEAVWPQYERYFERILRHQGPQGWYTRRALS